MGTAAIGIVLLVASAAPGQDVNALDTRLTPEVLAALWPGAERVGTLEGEPPSAPVYMDGEVAGYIFSTLDVVARRGYSNALFDILGAVDLNSTLKSAQVISHSEPHIVHDIERQVKLDTLLVSLNGYDTRRRSGDALRPDYVSGATVSARAMRAATIEAAVFVLRARSRRPVVDAPTVDLDGFRRATWQELLEDGSIARKAITNREVTAALARSVSADPETFNVGSADEAFLDLYTGAPSSSATSRRLRSPSALPRISSENARATIATAPSGDLTS